ncbi:uncharacterized protein A4U43_C08F34240 [Asparagus officinalis]|nr:uncharacterized protein A4U43_C08F34240 [Asparagus officinalis]
MASGNAIGIRCCRRDRRPLTRCLGISPRGERSGSGILPPELSNLKFVNLEREIFDVKNRLEELGKIPEESKIAVGIGDLKELDSLGDDLLNCLVKEITRALEMKKGRFWVMGWSATYETYMKFLSRYPTLDKDWDLQLQLITSAARQPAVSRPPSLMESFVPFGGFFPSTYESNIPVMKPYSSVPRCQLCNDKYEEELAIILKGSAPSCIDQNQAKLPLWLQNVDMVRMNNQLDVSKVKDDEKVLNVRAADLQKKWNDYCQRLHQGFPKPLIRIDQIQAS